MRMIRYSFTIICTLLMWIHFSVVHAQQYRVEPLSSTLKWIGKKVAGQHNGEVKLKSGEFTLKNGHIVSGNFIIDMTSIIVTDLKGEKKEKLEFNLKTTSFFDTEGNPTATFILTNCENKSDEKGSTHLLSGILTIKGISNTISFPARITSKDNKLVAIADLKINRSIYNRPLAKLKIIS